MSRVFVSSARRDGAAADRVSEVLRELGHEPVDDRDDSAGTAWWNEVVDRIESCEVFLALVSPWYAEAHACRLAAKYAASGGLRVLRLDLSRMPVTGIHPVVATAPASRFDGADPSFAARLERLLDHVEPEELEEPQEPQEPPPEPVVESDVETALGTDVDEREEPPRWLGRFEVLVVAATALVAAALLAYALGLGGSDGSADGPGDEAGSTGAGSEERAAPVAAVADSDVADLLRQVGAAGSARLPAVSCAAGEGQVTCRRPAPNVQAVVLRPYDSLRELYAAYTEEVEALTGETVPEGTGRCDQRIAEGERTWDAGGGPGDDVGIEEQAAGGLDPVTQAAGRVFCTESSQVVRLVWTQDPGVLVTATGQPASVVLAWWQAVHLELACAALDEPCGGG